MEEQCRRRRWEAVSEGENCQSSVERSEEKKAKKIGLFGAMKNWGIAGMKKIQVFKLEGGLSERERKISRIVCYSNTISKCCIVLHLFI